MARFSVRWMRFPLLLAFLPATAAPNTYHATSAIWQHTKKCDMLEHASEYNVAKGIFTTQIGGWQYPYPAYTDGTWIRSTAHQPSVTASVPMACDATSVCAAASHGCEGSKQSSEVCKHFHTACYADRRSPVFDQNLGTLKWVWQPSNGVCRVPILSSVVDYLRTTTGRLFRTG